MGDIQRKDTSETPTDRSFGIDRRLVDSQWGRGPQSPIVRRVDMQPVATAADTCGGGIADPSLNMALIVRSKCHAKSETFALPPERSVRIPATSVVP